MFGQTWYHETLQKYIVLFGTLFNSVWVNREDNEGEAKQSFKIPISYSPRDKMLARINNINEQNDPLEQPFSAILPRMGFEITGFNYAAERKLATVNRFAKKSIDQENAKFFQYNPVPYDITFSLSIYVKYSKDGMRIIEQILPYFTPEWTTTVKLLDTPEIILDIPLIINNIVSEDTYEGSFEDRRVIIWTLDFTMKAFLFGPTKKQKVITLANTHFFDATLFEPMNTSDITLTKINLYPGLDAVRNPTTDKDITLPRDQIFEDDNYGVIVDRDEQVE